jgi:hypothetical protein
LEPPCQILPRPAAPCGALVCSQIIRHRRPWRLRSGAAFYAGLNERGWVEGRNILIEGRYAAGRTERFAEFAADLVALDAEVIVVLGGTQATQVAKDATSKIPIVFAGISNPIESGFITSFARPGGNVTGVSNQLGDLPRKSLSSCYALSSQTSSAFDHGSLRSPRCRPPSRRALEMIASTIAAAMGLQSERTPGTARQPKVRALLAPARVFARALWCAALR